ncbi:hypothetical protein FKM82_002971 [Ascaphus truei]
MYHKYRAPCNALGVCTHTAPLLDSTVPLNWSSKGLNWSRHQSDPCHNIAAFGCQNLVWFVLQAPRYKLPRAAVPVYQANLQEQIVIVGNT